MNNPSPKTAEEILKKHEIDYSNKYRNAIEYIEDLGGGKCKYVLESIALSAIHTALTETDKDKRIKELEEQVEHWKRFHKTEMDIAWQKATDAECENVTIQSRIAELEGQGTFTHRDMINLIEYCADEDFYMDEHGVIWKNAFDNGNKITSEEILTNFINDKSKSDGKQ